MQMTPMDVLILYNATGPVGGEDLAAARAFRETLKAISWFAVDTIGRPMLPTDAKISAPVEVEDPAIVWKWVRNFLMTKPTVERLDVLVHFADRFDQREDCEKCIAQIVEKAHAR